MERRTYLTSLATASLTTVPTVHATAATIDVTIHVTKGLANTSWTSKDSHYPAEVAQTYLQSCYDTFENYDTDITISDEIVQMPAEADPFTWWDEHTRTWDGDCHLLLTEQYDEQYKGKASCFGCDDADDRPWYNEDASNCAVVNYCTTLYETANSYNLWMDDGETGARELHAILHEVGHCLGLTHGLGYAKQQYDDAYDVTPMLGAYTLYPVDEQPTSHTGRERVHVDESDATWQMFMGDDVYDYVDSYGFNMTW